MDEKTLYWYFRYFGTGLFGGILSFILIYVITGEALDPFSVNLLATLIVIYGGLGGLLGGVIDKGFRGAFVGGFILFGLTMLIVIWLLNSICP